MLVIRCTRRLLDRVGPPVAPPPESTTALGDWYAKPFGVARKRFVLMISESTRIAIVMPSRAAADLARSFRHALAILLESLGVPADAVEREIAASQEVLLAVTDSRSLLGTLNDFSTLAKSRLRDRPDTALDDLSVSLSHSPVAPLGYRRPADLARELFGLVSRQPLDARSPGGW